MAGWRQFTELPRDRCSMKCTSVGDQQIETMVELTQKLGSWDPVLWELKRAWTGKYAQDLPARLSVFYKFDS
jgi:hypothetical protein